MIEEVLLGLRLGPPHSHLYDTGSEDGTAAEGVDYCDRGGEGPVDGDTAAFRRRVNLLQRERDSEAISG